MKKSVLLILFIMLFSVVSCGSSATEKDSINDADVTEDSDVFTDTKSFVSVWKIEEDDLYKSIILPLVRTGSYDFVVDWGDGSKNSVSDWDDITKKRHGYKEAGLYTIIITGKIVGWSFGSEPYSAENIVEVSRWGSLGFGDTSAQFAGCLYLTITATDAPSLLGTLSLGNAFSGCRFLTEIPSSSVWDTSEIMWMAGMFNNCSYLTHVGFIEQWNVSKVVNMDSMFSDARMWNQDISAWDVSNVTIMSNMFRYAMMFDYPLTEWDVSSVTDMYEMFLQATKFDQDISSWDITQVGSCKRMFDGVALSTKNYDALLVSWSQQNVTKDIEFSGGNSQYSSGEAADARQKLIDEHGWVITDGGLTE